MSRPWRRLPAWAVAVAALGCGGGAERAPGADRAAGGDAAAARPAPPPDTVPPAPDSIPPIPPGPAPPVSSADSAYLLLTAADRIQIRPGVTCYDYGRYLVLAWESPDPDPVAIVRQRAPDAAFTRAACDSDSLAGDFVVRNEWAEYYYGLWRDLLLLDSGTGQLRDILLYDVPSRKKVLTLEAVELAGLVDSVTVRVWLLRGNGTRAQCPDIPDGFDVGMDSLYAFHLPTLKLTALGEGRCHQLQ